MISFDTDMVERGLIDDIVARAMKDLGPDVPTLAAKELNMDITACHCNGTPLDLPKLLAAPEPHFGHDVLGIRRFIDRSTGKLPENKFSPRCRQHEQLREEKHEQRRAPASVRQPKAGKKG